MKVCVDDFRKPPTICNGGNGCDDCMNVSIGDKKPGEWRRVEGNFIGISGANISCRCALSPLGMAPFAHLSDGYLDLILVKKASRLGHLRYLLRTASDSRRAVSQCKFKKHSDNMSFRIRYLIPIFFVSPSSPFRLWNATGWRSSFSPPFSVVNRCQPKI